MNNKNNEVVVEEFKGELVATIFSQSNQKESEREVAIGQTSMDVDLLRRLLKVVDLEKDAEEMVTEEYIIKKLQLTKKETKLIKESIGFEFFKFPVMDIPSKINEWNKAGNIAGYPFSSEEMKKKMIADKSTLELDVTQGMARILPMPQWGECGGVYAVKTLTDTERRYEIKLVLKYMENEEYVYSEYITVKPSELVYGYEGEEKLRKNLDKLKRLMDYSPAATEPLNYKELYVALYYFNEKITTRIVRSDKLSFNKTYELLVKTVYEFAKGEGGKGIFGNGYYILTAEELGYIAELAGYSVKEIVVLFKERGLLETDSDKMSRNQKTVDRDGKKTKYYCVLTSESYNKRCNANADMLTVSEEDSKRCNEFFQKLINDTKHKKKASKAAVLAFNGGEQL